MQKTDENLDRYTSIQRKSLHFIRSEECHLAEKQRGQYAHPEASVQELRLILVGHDSQKEKRGDIIG